MYGAKATQIAKVAGDVWGVKPSEKQAVILNDAITAIDADNSVALDTLNLPPALKTEEFRRLVISLAKNPLVA